MTRPRPATGGVTVAFGERPIGPLVVHEKRRTVGLVAHDAGVLPRFQRVPEDVERVEAMRRAGHLPARTPRGAP